MTEVVIGSIKDLLEGFDKTFEELNVSETFTAFIPVLEQEHGIFFTEQIDPGGESWSRLAETTVKRKGHSQILLDTGDLGESIFGGGADHVELIEPRSLTFGTSISYSIFSQEGTVNMPQREHVGITDEKLDQLTLDILDSLVEDIKRN